MALAACSDTAAAASARSGTAATAGALWCDCWFSRRPVVWLLVQLAPCGVAAGSAGALWCEASVCRRGDCQDSLAAGQPLEFGLAASIAPV